MQKKYASTKLEKLYSNPREMQKKFTANPNTNISKFINAYKSASSRIIKKEFPEIKQQL